MSQRPQDARSARTYTVAAVTEVLDRLAPPSLAQPWDNVGLLTGDGRAACRAVLVCIDLTPAVLAEAAAGRCELVVAYHPPLFRPVARLRADGTGTDAVVHRAITCGLAIHSPHTALDAAPGGTNDVLAEACGLCDLEPFEYSTPAAARSKLVTFVPPDKVEQVAAAMFAAGAGRIGRYEQCSYRLAGEGTFFGTHGASPKVGRRGRLEKVPETRIEVVVPDHLLPEVVNALLAGHPYEEPAYDVYPLSEPPSFGIGRVGTLPPRTTLGGLARTLRKATGSKVAMLVGPPGTPIRRAAVCAGAAGRLPLEKPRAAGAEVIVTGEIRHHDALAIRRASKTAIALGHWESERLVLGPLARRLRAALPGLRVEVSRRDRGPFTPGP